MVICSSHMMKVIHQWRRSRTRKHYICVSMIVIYGYVSSKDWQCTHKWKVEEEKLLKIYDSLYSIFYHCFSNIIAIYNDTLHNSFHKCAGSSGFDVRPCDYNRFVRYRNWSVYYDVYWRQTMVIYNIIYILHWLNYWWLTLLV